MKGFVRLVYASINWWNLCTDVVDVGFPKLTCLSYISFVESLVKQLEYTRQECHRLKCEKLELLRQNVVSTNPSPAVEFMGLNDTPS